MKEKLEQKLNRLVTNKILVPVEFADWGTLIVPLPRIEYLFAVLTPFLSYYRTRIRAGIGCRVSVTSLVSVSRSPTEHQHITPRYRKRKKERARNREREK